MASRPALIHILYQFDYTINIMIEEHYVITFVTTTKITLDFLKEHKRITDLEKSEKHPK